MFVFIVCQCQTERLVKAWMTEHVPQARFAFSRPGLLTFKLVENPVAAAQSMAACPFARCYGWSWETISGDLGSVAAALTPRLLETRATHLHCWARDERPVGDRGFEPFTRAEWTEWGRELRALMGEQAKSMTVNQTAQTGENIIDVIQVESDRWLIGWHSAAGAAACWTGGVPPLEAKPVVSRAYYKIEEAIRWSRLPVSSGELALELGAAPGGACQALLERGLRVIGVDPAEIAPEVLAHPQFEHWRMRAAEIRKRNLTHLDWLICDSNVAPQHTLDSVEGIVTNQHVQPRGLILTLKMPDWKLFDHLNEYLERIRGWGFADLRIRHLAFNRQELCVVAHRTG